MKTSTKNLKSTSSVKPVKKEKIHSIQITILVLVVLQLLLSVSMILPISKTSSSSDIEEKLTRLDNFFASNAPGYGGTPSGDSPSAQVAAPSAGSQVEVSADDDPFLGSNDAKVTVIEFSDYQCPFCRKYWQESYPQLKKEYIDTGKIKYVFRDFPLGFHPSAPLAAIAGNCVREQKGNEGYFAFHDIAFGEQAKLGQGTIQFTEADVFSWVAQLDGIDQDQFDTCYNDPAQKAEVDADFAAGSKAGVSGTPSFFVNGNILVGAQPYSVIKAEIERALAE